MREWTKSNYLSVIMWDLALIQAIIDPSMATTRRVLTPPENEQREVEVYDTVDVDRMRVDFFEALR